MQKKIIKAGALLGALAVVFGALGAHALKSVLDSSALESFETGVRYQMYHAIVLLVLAKLFTYESKSQVWMYRLMLWGVLLFSGSIYLLTFDEWMGVKLSFLGPVTPLGGLLMIAGWIMLFLNGVFLKNK